MKRLFSEIYDRWINRPVDLLSVGVGRSTDWVTSPLLIQAFIQAMPNLAGYAADSFQASFELVTL
jgi:hypothetical protein